MTTEGGGWTVIQRRVDGSTDFYRDWQAYKAGFGDPKKNFWMGNNALHLLTKSGNHILRVDLQRRNGQKAYAKYSKFSVGDGSSKYKLTVSGHSGTAGDSLSMQNGMNFSTKDRDNDVYSSSCAQNYKSAWWYKKCFRSDLNGLYKSHIYWHDWKHGEGMKRSTMMIRPW